MSRYYTKNGLPWADDPETKKLDPYSIAPGDSTVRFHRNRDPRFYASIGFDRGNYDVQDVYKRQLKGTQLDYTLSQKIYLFDLHYIFQQSQRLICSDKVDFIPKVLHVLFFINRPYIHF